MIQTLSHFSLLQLEPQTVQGLKSHTQVNTSRQNPFHNPKRSVTDRLEFKYFPFFNWLSENFCSSDPRLTGQKRINVTEKGSKEGERRVQRREKSHVTGQRVLGDEKKVKQTETEKWEEKVGQQKPLTPASADH